MNNYDPLHNEETSSSSNPHYRSDEETLTTNTTSYESLSSSLVDKLKLAHIERLMRKGTSNEVVNLGT